MDASILDGTLDAIADLPGFKVYPSGAHRVEVIHFIEKQIGVHPAVEFAMRLVTTHEQSNPADEVAKPGDEQNMAFMLDNEIGQGMFKRAITPLYNALKATSIKDAMSRAAGLQVDIVMTKTVDTTKNPPRQYANLDKLELA